MIDFHCHFLAQIDDGAESVEESLLILNELVRQKVTCVCATPHFKSDMIDLESFLQNRQAAYEKIYKFIPANIEVRLGAEVLITPYLLEMKKIERLCIENSAVIMLEMPFSPWQQWMFDVIKRTEAEGLTAVIVHPERYYEGKTLFKYKRFLEKEDIYMQFNADSFLNIRTRSIIKKFLKNENVRPLLGSDAHGYEYRTPKIDQAKKKILSDFGFNTYMSIKENSKIIF